MTDLNFFVRDSQGNTEETLNSTASETYLSISEQKNRSLQERLERSLVLHQSEIVTDTVLEYVELASAKAKAQYAYSLMLLAVVGIEEESYMTVSNQVDSLLLEAIKLNNKDEWIQAIYTLSIILQDDWKGAEKTLQRIKVLNAPFPNKEGQSIKEFLVNPPTEIKLYVGFKKNEKKLNTRLMKE